MYAYYYIVQSFCRHEEVFYLIMAYNETLSELLIIYYLITALNGTLYLWIVVLDRTLYNSLIVAYKGIVYSFNESNVKLLYQGIFIRRILKKISLFSFVTLHFKELYSFPESLSYKWGCMWILCLFPFPFLVLKATYSCFVFQNSIIF